jgi:beta-mannosidase
VPKEVCSVSWAPVCTPAGSAATCELTVRATARIPLSAEPRATLTLAVPGDVADPGGARSELVSAEVEGGAGPDVRRALWFFGEDRDLALPPGAVDVGCERVEAGYRLRVTARELVRDLAVLVDQVDPDAVVDDMLLTLLPGDVAELTVTTTAEVEPDAFTAPTVFRSANQLA